MEALAWVMVINTKYDLYLVKYYQGEYISQSRWYYLYKLFSQTSVGEQNGALILS